MGGTLRTARPAAGRRPRRDGRPARAARGRAPRHGARGGLRCRDAARLGRRAGAHRRCRAPGRSAVRDAVRDHRATPRLEARPGPRGRQPPRRLGHGRRHPRAVRELPQRARRRPGGRRGGTRGGPRRGVRRRRLLPDGGPRRGRRDGQARRGAVAPDQRRRPGLGATAARRRRTGARGDPQRPASARTPARTGRAVAARCRTPSRRGAPRPLARPAGSRTTECGRVVRPAARLRRHDGRHRAGQQPGRVAATRRTGRLPGRAQDRRGRGAQVRRRRRRPRARRRGASDRGVRRPGHQVRARGCWSARVRTRVSRWRSA